MSKMAASSKAAAKGSKKAPSKHKTQQRPKTSKSPAKTAKEQKSKPASANATKKRRRRVYTEKELDIPKLNTITPAGVKKPKGKKKGKVFVDDQASMMTILAMVNADKEGQIESKMIKARQMEEIRQARQKEMEARQELRKNKLEDTKNSLRRQQQRKNAKMDDSDVYKNQTQDSAGSKSKSGSKRVSFK